MPLTPAAGARVSGRYELIRQLAKGGMAEVWEAEDTVLARPVAVKILLPHLAADEAFVVRFRREAVAAARLSHPHIVSIYDTCAGDECEAIVMELVRGTTVRDLLDERGALPVRRAVDVAAQVADALSHAHEHGLVHRDVKPGNILLSDDGRVLVADFGIAKAAEATSDLTEAGQVVGTAKYLSPEQVEGKPLDARSDIYSLGVVLYEMLCGRAPFTAENSTATALLRITTEPLRPRQIRAGIPRSVEDIVLRAMARAPETRYQTASELRAALESVDLTRVDDGDATTTLPPVPGPAHDPTPVPSTAAFVRRERAWLVPASLILVVALTLGIVGLIVGQTDVGHSILGGGTKATTTLVPQPIRVLTPQAFDPPPGDGEENDGSLGNLIDGKPDTTWNTQTYNNSQFGGLKSGVGVVLPLAAATSVGSITVDSPTVGWKASIYVADAPKPTLAAWGQPIATLNGAGTAQLRNRTVGAVLVWITDLGPADRVVISEIRLAH